MAIQLWMIIELICLIGLFIASIKFRKMAIASFILSLIGLIGFSVTNIVMWTPQSSQSSFVNIFHAYLWPLVGFGTDIFITITAIYSIIVIGLVLGILSLRRETRRKLAIAGIVLNSIVILLPFVEWGYLWLAFGTW